MTITNTIKNFLSETGNIARFTGRYLSLGISPPYEIKEFLTQCYIIGYRSLGLLSLTGFIIGLVLTMQLRPSLVSYGVESQLPAMVGIAIIREIGPVIAALIFAGKISSSIGAEIGSMKVTEQIDAMEVSGTNPFRYLVATRVLATTLMLPILIILADSISLLGAWIGVNINSTTSLTLFFTQVFNSLGFSDIVPAFIKTFFFGFAVGIVGAYKGYTAAKGTRGVGNAANSAVVLSSVMIFLIDLLAVQITGMLGFN
ncbi:MlaE family ABC transporter permease [Chryseobacterium sp. Hurlbut01]|uniref:MlaE family ABC transporter permease n=1 Tax=Chryseobacterium sp. Hurlbut01 TaxID=1681828 RepID=UPI00067B66E9|nr:ABC transporter permease [Chryseobacterium sp. Hurlbut01]KNB62549.1 ABC transporter permease [Chryseobacterium sp. Hurlbut01]